MFFYMKTKMNMNACYRVVIAALLLGFLVEISYARGPKKNREEKMMEPSLASEDAMKNISYGPRMQSHAQFNDYCNNSPCSNYQPANRLSQHDRKTLRQQVNEASKTLYSR